MSLTLSTTWLIPRKHACDADNFPVVGSLETCHTLVALLLSPVIEIGRVSYVLDKKDRKYSHSWMTNRLQVMLSWTFSSICTSRLCQTFYQIPPEKILASLMLTWVWGVWSLCYNCQTRCIRDPHFFEAQKEIAYSHCVWWESKYVWFSECRLFC